MPKISVNTSLARLSFEDFKKWVERTLPGHDPVKLYKSIGGKVPGKKKGA